MFPAAIVIAPQNIVLPLSRPSSPVASTSAITLDVVPEPTAHELPDVSPPAYSRRDTAPPSYIEQDKASTEPFTVARMLFHYGFLFPLFWLVGAFRRVLTRPWWQILTMPPNPPASWEESKTEEERAALLKVLRVTEVKWGKRCLYATLGFAVLLLVIILAAISSMRR
ncbi:hypothetical protein BKA62DRAFT_668058 [Auriculariales sp. MPI-PUGE-AT-0066]|nr:hypothetical protein BKA62DRAFT_668058 [Auriculariales sp. MPI-PUGE-AT-0066]